MSEPWLLEITQAPVAPRPRVGGLSTPLRLAREAQWAGATAVLVRDDSLAAELRDARLRIPLERELNHGARVVRVPSSYVVHRSLFAAALATTEQVVSLSELRLPCSAPYGFEPIDVVDGASRQRAERALFRSLRKVQDGWTSRHLNRYISLAISRWLVKTPLLPNQVSIVILGIGLIGAWLAARGDYWSLVFGALLFQSQSVLDGCDGEMSRVTYRGSRLGEWLDTVGDDLTNYSFFAGAGLGLFRQTGNPLYLWAAGLTVLSGALASGIEYRYLIKIGSGDLLKYPLNDPQKQAEPSASFFVALEPLFKRDTFVLLTHVAALLGLVGPMLVLFAAAAFGILLKVIGAELRMARERRA